MNIKYIATRYLSKLVGNELMKHTQWYRSMFVDPDLELYPGNSWYRKHLERNFDIVCLGSSSAKWAYDFSGFDVKGMNWAQQPQTLLEDFNLLRNYHSILRKGGFVVITIMPFTGLNKKTGLIDALKYLKLDAQEPIEPNNLEQAWRYTKYPFLFRKQAFKALAKYVLGRETVYLDRRPMVENNPLDERALDLDALKWMNGWKNQFAIDDFEAPLTEENLKGREFRITLLRQIIDFCVERDYVPIYVIPPVTQQLYRYFTPQFQQLYIYTFLSDVGREVKLLDYSKCKELMNKDFYFNSFFLNKKGRSAFTLRLLEDLGFGK